MQRPTQNKSAPIKESGASTILTPWPAPGETGSELILKRGAKQAATFTVVAQTGAGCSPPSPSVRRFVNLLNAGINAWRDAGIFYALEVNKNPEFPRQIITACPSITMEMLHSFERVGRGTVIPQLLLIDHRPGIKPMLTWPIEQQAKYLTHPIEVVDGKEVLQILANNLSRAQCKQVFFGNKIRSVPEQRQWLHSRQLPKAKWSVIGNRIFISGQCYFTARQIREMLDELAKE